MMRGVTQSIDGGSLGGWFCGSFILSPPFLSPCTNIPTLSLRGVLLRPGFNIFRFGTEALIGHFRGAFFFSFTGIEDMETHQEKKS